MFRPAQKDSLTRSQSFSSNAGLQLLTNNLPAEPERPEDNMLLLLDAVPLSLAATVVLLYALVGMIGGSYTLNLATSFGILFL